MSKRSMVISTKISPEDWKLLQDAAAKRWADAPISRSSLLLGLAKIGARIILTHPEVEASFSMIEKRKKSLVVAK